MNGANFNITSNKRELVYNQPESNKKAKIENTVNQSSQDILVSKSKSYYEEKKTYYKSLCN